MPGRHAQGHGVPEALVVVRIREDGTVQKQIAGPDAPPKDACLHLDPLTVKSQLPLKKPLPLTVEHLPDAPVGSVFGLYQSRAGLFSAASITSGDFLSLLDSIYHDCDIAQSQRLPLPREPKVEALHAWLPSLSLASLHPDIPQTTYSSGTLRANTRFVRFPVFITASYLCPGSPARHHGSLRYRPCVGPEAL